jgi:hypothetical protein
VWQSDRNPYDEILGKRDWREGMAGSLFGPDHPLEG